MHNRINVGVYGSFDGGATWNPVLTHTDQMQSMDPACAFGIDDHAYFVALSRNKDLTPRLYAYYSEDGAKTWHASTIPESVRSHVDREYITVDTSYSKYRGHVYLHGAILRAYGLDNTSPVVGVRLYRSLDSGHSFDLPIQRLLPDRTTVLHPSNGVVLSDGTFVTLLAQLDLDKRNDSYASGGATPALRPNGVLKVITSRDGGESFDQDAEISNLYGDWRPNASQVPGLAADVHGPVFRDRLYAVWADGRFGSRTQIVMSYSNDKGKTWSKPRLVSDDRAPTRGNLERPAALPVIAVNKNGVVGVSWLDRRASPNDVNYQVRFAASLDGGETFMPSVRVSERPGVADEEELWMVKGVTTLGSPARVIIVREPEMRPGDTAGLATDPDGTFHPLWIDNRTSIRQVWTAAVSVKGKIGRYGEEGGVQVHRVRSRMPLTQRQ